MKLTTAAVAAGILSLVLALEYIAWMGISAHNMRLEYIAWMGISAHNMRAALEPEYEPITKGYPCASTENCCWPFPCAISIEGTKP